MAMNLARRDILGDRMNRLQLFFVAVSLNAYAVFRVSTVARGGLVVVVAMRSRCSRWAAVAVGCLATFVAYAYHSSGSWFATKLWSLLHQKSNGRCRRCYCCYI